MLADHFRSWWSSSWYHSILGRRDSFVVRPPFSLDSARSLAEDLLNDVLSSTVNDHSTNPIGSLYSDEYYWLRRAFLYANHQAFVENWEDHSRFEDHRSEWAKYEHVHVILDRKTTLFTTLIYIKSGRMKSESRERSIDDFLPIPFILEFIHTWNDIRARAFGIQWMSHMFVSFSATIDANYNCWKHDYSYCFPSRVDSTVFFLSVNCNRVYLNSFLSDSSEFRIGHSRKSSFFCLSAVISSSSHWRSAR